MASLVESSSAPEQSLQTVSGYTLLPEARELQKQYRGVYRRALRQLQSKKLRFIFTNYLHYYENLHNMPEWIVHRYIGKISDNDKRINASLNGAIENLAREVLAYSTRWKDFYRKYPDVSHIAFLLVRYPQVDTLNKQQSKTILSQLYPVG